MLDGVVELPVADMVPELVAMAIVLLMAPMLLIILLVLIMLLILLIALMLLDPLPRTPPCTTLGAEPELSLAALFLKSAMDSSALASQDVNSTLTVLRVINTTRRGVIAGSTHGGLTAKTMPASQWPGVAQ